MQDDNKSSPQNQDGKPNNPFTPNLPPFTSATQGKSEVNEPPTPNKAKKTDYMSTPQKQARQILELTHCKTPSNLVQCSC